MANIVRVIPYCETCGAYNLDESENERFTQFHKETPVRGFNLQAGEVFGVRNPNLRPNTLTRMVIEGIPAKLGVDDYHNQTYFLSYLHILNGQDELPLYKQRLQDSENLIRTRTPQEQIHELTDSEFEDFRLRLEAERAQCTRITEIVEENVALWATHAGFTSIRWDQLKKGTIHKFD